MVNWMEYMNYDTLRRLVKKYEKPNRKNSLILIPFSAFPKVEEKNNVREYECGGSCSFTGKFRFCRCQLHHTLHLCQKGDFQDAI